MAKVKGAEHLRGWKIVTDDLEPGRNKYYESVLTLGNGYLGSRGAYEETTLDENNGPLTLIAEVYDDPESAEPSRSAPAPHWQRILFNDGSGTFNIWTSKILSQERTLDMKRGTLMRHVRFEGGDGRITSIISTRLVSMARPHIAAIAYSIIPENYSGEVKLSSAIDGNATYWDGVVQLEEASKERDGNTIAYAARTLESKVDIVEVARHLLVSDGEEVDADVSVKKPENRIGLEFKFNAEQGRVYTLEKTVAIDTSMHSDDPLASAKRMAADAPSFAKLEKEHVAEWKEYWKDSEIKIGGDSFVQTMSRFFVFQLLQAACKNNVKMGLSASIPAKTLSGPGYNGHIFWDTEIYMLPFYAQQYPEIGKQLLMYRYDRLDTAQQNAAKEGRRGARFPWESAGDGVETTPSWCATGWMEIHVIADVAFGVWQHYITTGDKEFLLGPGLELIVETARYWGTRAEKVDIDGSYQYEISGVISPDEYHDDVNNSAFTNAVARWNLNKAMELLEQIKQERPEFHKEVIKRHELTDSELAQWQDVAEKLKINFDPDTGLYEEFDGYFDLTGKDAIIKQADVLLMLYLLPELRTKDIFRKNFDLYYPRTDHGSSLSPAVHVLFALDIGYRDHAYSYEVQTCSIDGTRRGGASDAGLHAASLGGGWSSIVAGFGGVRVMPDHLSVAPDLPDKWKSLEFSIQYQGLRLRFYIEPNNLRIDAAPEGNPVDLQVFGKRVTIHPGETIQGSY